MNRKQRIIFWVLIAIALVNAFLAGRAFAASVDTHPKGEDAKQASALLSSAVAKPDAPNQSSSPSQPNGENNG